MTKDQKEEALLKSRVIPIIGRIETSLVNDVQKAVFQMYFDNPKEPIDLVVDSGGGSVGPALSIYDFLKGLPFKVTATVIGSCNSAALLIISACSKRRATFTSRFLFHAMRTDETLISTEDVNRQLEEMVKRQTILFGQGLDIQSRAFGISKDELKLMMIDGEKFNIKLSAEEAKEKGIIHEIVEKFDFFDPAKI